MADIIRDIRTKMEQAFQQSQNSQQELERTIQLWLLSLPLLKDKNSQFVVELSQKLANEKNTANFNRIIQNECLRKGFIEITGSQFLEQLSQKEPSQNKILTQECLRKISPLSRLLLFLRYRYQCKQNELAQMMCVGEAQISKYIKKAKEELKVNCKDLYRQFFKEE